MDASPLHLSYFFPNHQGFKDAQLQSICNRIKLNANSCINKVKDGEWWAGITQSITADGAVVAVSFPLITIKNSDVQKVKDHVYTKLKKSIEFKNAEVSEDRPDHSGSWSDVLVYQTSKIQDRPITTTMWLAQDSPTVVKRSRNAGAYDVNDPFVFWNGLLYVAKSYTAPSIMDESNIVDPTSAGVTDKNIPSFTHCMTKSETYDYEDWQSIHNEIVKLFIEARCDDESVWLDVISSIVKVTHNMNKPDEVLHQFLSAFGDDYYLDLDSHFIVEYAKEMQLLSRKKKLTITPLTLIEHLKEKYDDLYLIWYNKNIDDALNILYELHPQRQGRLIDMTSKLFARTVMLDCLYSGANKKWFEYDNYRKVWTQNTDMVGPIMQNRLSNYIKGKSESIETHADMPDQAGLNCLRQVIELLSDETFRMKTLSESRHKLFQDDFDSIKNLNTKILPFHNACVEVIDIDGNKKCAIRSHRRQDYFTNVCSTNYIDLSWDHPDVVEIMEFFRKFINDEESRESLLYWLGSTLYRGNYNRTILILIGDGANAKTAFISMVSKVMESFMVQMKSNAFYGRQSASTTADTDLVGIVGAAIAYIEEVEKGKAMRTSTNKGLSGGGTIRLRDLYEGERTVESTAKLMYVLNNDPIFTKDRAMIDRLLFIQATSRFDKNAPPTIEEQERTHHYPEDPYYSQKIQKLAPALLWVMVEYLKRYLKIKTIPRSKKSQEYADKYWDRYDIYREFFTLHYSPIDPGAKSIIRINDVILAANKHFNKHLRRNEYSRKDLIDYIIEVYGTKSRDNPIGYDDEGGLLHNCLIEKVVP